jgi:hypothetical protein
MSQHDETYRRDDSAQPCGCDPGIPYKAPDCLMHQIEIQIEHRDTLTGYQKDKTIGRPVLKSVLPEPDTMKNTTPATPVIGGHPRFFELLEEMKTLHASKGHDYSKTEDPLSNLRSCEAFGIDAWKGVLIRMSDKWSRIRELTNGKTAKHESLRDSLFDLSAYALLCLILLEEKGEK